ncbi:trimethylamine methyltransferase family protein [Ruegeria aquimaris]|uniref:Trimethylamine methyltransferase family protein n=1 Tax=Ruegeria aquimaris TaxID=2984333 RepID=A0ABT3AQC0_9RHOB|nr:trimethylamine methyltransferase family protein [Ruegeria sp. XHP0148]MCV2890777.1 trimethylamine methyltransferase family protein [Ruegeria sp. XHP0148]
MARRASRGTAAPAGRPSTRAVGGSWAPLANADAHLIADAAFDILERVGLSEAPPDVSALVSEHGGRSHDGRLMFPRELVENMLALSPKTVTLCGQAPENDLIVGGTETHPGTGGAAPNVADLNTGDIRPSSLLDLRDAARLADALPHVHFFSRSLVAGDISDPLALDLNTAFASLCGTSKHVMVQASDLSHVPHIARMCHLIAGSEDAFRARPFLSLNINHVVPPLRLHAESARVLIEAARLGIPVHANVFGQLGASSPVTLAGSVAQTLAEALAGIVLAQLAAPGALVIAGPRPMITDLRTGGFSGGSGEQAMATAMAVQVLRLWSLPCSVIAGATDSKLPDHQAGYEKALTVLTAMQAGAHLVTQAAGTQAGLMAVDFSAMVADNDMLGALMRANMPPVVDQTTLALDAIADVARGEGHYLGRPETYARMRSDFLYPEVADRSSITDWQTAGATDMAARARQRAIAILRDHHPSHLSSEMRVTLLQAFPSLKA